MAHQANPHIARRSATALLRVQRFTVTATVALAATFISTAPTAGAPQNPAPQDEISQRINVLATVNGQEITRQQISTEAMRRFGESVLEEITKKKLVFDYCQKNGITITEKDVNDELASMAAKTGPVGMSTENYIRMICEGRKITVDRLKNDLIWHTLAMRRLAEQRTSVTADELNERMEYEFGAKVQVRQIVLDSMQQAQQIRAQLETNVEDFERLAKQFSVDGNTKSLGGLLLPIRRNSGLPELENRAFALQPGQVSDIFPIADKFVILRCERHFPETQIPTAELAAIHERISEQIARDKLADAAGALFEQMQQESQVVNVMNDPQLSQQNPGVAAIVNGTRIQKNMVGEECIIRFGEAMLETEVERTILLQALKSAGIQVTQEDINNEILRVAKAESVAVNANGEVDVDQWLAYVTGNDRSKIDLYIEDEIWPSVALAKLVAGQVEVTQEDMNKGFEANFGPRVEALAMVFTDNRQAMKIWNMASANPTAEYFGQLANQYSVDPMSKNNFGQIRPIQKHGGHPELEQEAFSLQAGELSRVVQDGEYYIILFCQGRTEPVVTDFDAVKEELYSNILYKKTLIKKAEVFQDLLETAQIDNFLSGTSQAGKRAESNPHTSALPFRGQTQTR